MFFVKGGDECVFDESENWFIIFVCVRGMFYDV